jgi:hypothetical protein
LVLKVLRKIKIIAVLRWWMRTKNKKIYWLKINMSKQPLVKRMNNQIWPQKIRHINFRIKINALNCFKKGKGISSHKFILALKNRSWRNENWKLLRKSLKKFNQVKKCHKVSCLGKKSFLWWNITRTAGLMNCLGYVRNKSK